MNRHWVDGADRVAAFGRGARRQDAMVPSQPTETSDVAGRLALIEDAEQLRETARLDGPMYQATERFIDSLYGPTARPIQVEGVPD